MELHEYEGESYVVWYDALIWMIAMCLAGALFGILFGFLSGEYII